MKINIYYGGRGLMDDPTLFVINKMQEVFEELNIKVERYHLHELKNSITALPQTLKEADGVVLASTVEWYGIGGYMQTFLDACWQYGNKEKIHQIYMLPVVMSTTYGEREGKLHLSVAWEFLGGLPCSGICGYIPDIKILEQSDDYKQIIEKKCENMYRTINQKLPSLPASNQAINKIAAVHPNTDLTPQETEQLSQYAADDTYVQKTKADIQELASYFKNILDVDEESGEDEYIRSFKANFNPQPSVVANYTILIEERQQPLHILVDGSKLQIFYGPKQDSDVEIQATTQIMDEITNKRMTFQRAFMLGSMKTKGDFKLLRMLDQLFQFVGAE